jgi:tetratricopeptide (TPR) repeat protein
MKRPARQPKSKASRKPTPAARTKAASILDLAWELRDNGDPKAAHAAALRALKLDPLSHHTWYSRAVFAGESGDHAQAIRILRTAIRKWPRQKHVDYMHAALLRELDQAGREKEAFLHACLIAPKHRNSGYLQTRAAEALLETDTAAAELCIRRALDLPYPREQKAWRRKVAVKVFRARKRWAELPRLHLQQLRDDPLNQVPRVQLAEAYAELGQDRKADRNWDRASRDCPNNIEAHLELAAAFAESYLDEGARFHLMSALELDEDDHRIWCELGPVMRRLGELDAAQEAAEIAVSLDPNCVVGMVRLGNIFADKGDLLKAEKAFERVTKLDPKDALAHDRLTDLRAAITHRLRPLTKLAKNAKDIDPATLRDWLLIPTQHDKGLSERELRAAERRYSFRFPPDLRACLAASLPTGPGFPNWRTNTRQHTIHDGSLVTWPLEKVLASPLQGLLFDLKHNAFWPRPLGPRPATDAKARAALRAAVKAAPPLIPIYLHRFIPATPDPGNPVLSVQQSDIVLYGHTLADFIQQEWTPNVRAAHARPRKVQFWTELLDRERPRPSPA